MTDDESRKAFENEMRRQVHSVAKDKEGRYVAARTHEKWVLWQVCVEWATKRERMRQIARLKQMPHGKYRHVTQPIIESLVSELQEPAP